MNSDPVSSRSAGEYPRQRVTLAEAIDEALEAETDCGHKHVMGVIQRARYEALKDVQRGQIVTPRDVAILEMAQRVCQDEYARHTEFKCPVYYQRVEMWCVPCWARVVAAEQLAAFSADSETSVSNMGEQS